MMAMLRALVIAAGAAVMAWSFLAIRVEDWPIYVTFVVLCVVLFRFYVEVLPGLTLPVPGLAMTFGFLYVGGPPIIVLRLAEPLVVLLLRATLPRRWREWVSVPIGAAGQIASVFWVRNPQQRSAAAAEWGMFSLGLAARWFVVTRMAPSGALVASPGTILLAEAAGYACWTFLSSLPIYAFGKLMPARVSLRARTVLDDLQVVFVMTLTPFVFLILYGYAALGLPGAAWWALSTLGLHFMLQSLTERRVAVEEQNRRLEALNRELEHRERLSAIGKMSSVVSHQMLQQLGIIRLHADLIRNADETVDPAVAVAQARDNAGRIEDALDGVNRVLTDLLVFSRDLRLNLYEHALDRVLAESVDDCRPQARARDVTLRLVCDPDLRVVLDKLKTKQAVTNVVLNALDVSPARAEVVIEGSRRDGSAEIAVTDRGPGVAPKDRQAIFTPFFTSKETGTGLGLAIAHEFVAAHGGTIAVEDASGGGSRFVIRLPSPSAASRDDPSRGTPRGEGPTHDVGRGVRR
jgi:signal transduction histidine kinase